MPDKMKLLWDLSVRAGSTAFVFVLTWLVGVLAWQGSRMTHKVGVLSEQVAALVVTMEQTVKVTDQYQQRMAKTYEQLHELDKAIDRLTFEQDNRRDPLAEMNTLENAIEQIRSDLHVLEERVNRRQ